MSPHARHAGQLKALGHPLRLSLLRVVVQGSPKGTPAGRIQTTLEIPASTLSHHLDALTRAGLLHRQRSGTSLFYAARYGALKKLTDYLWKDCCKGGRGQPCC